MIILGGIWLEQNYQTNSEGKQKTQLAGDDVRCVDCQVTLSVLEE